MHGLKHFIPAFACLAGLLLATEAIEEIPRESSSCYREGLAEYRELFGEVFREVFESKLGGTHVDIDINCISFNENRELERAIVSGESDTRTIVLEFSCVAGSQTLLALESERNFSRTENQSCLVCANSSTGDVCITPCAEKCGLCYEKADMCKCDGHQVYVYDVHEVEEAVEDLSERELGHSDEEIVRTIEETIIRLSSCETECHNGFEEYEHGDSRICYACGVEFCTECEEDKECTKCLPHTVLYHEDNECLFGFKAEVLEVVEEQEHEVEIEEEHKDQSRITLAVTLPISCVVVVIFFIIMSYIAHKRYPHIGDTGRTRHRNKPEPGPEVDLSISDTTFQIQPTVRLR